ncbi:MAG: aminotransferase class I/II-fold pyridoxal phosphate-dependent enzyme [Defluviitaleaceae bacterium]|nr:aminotransferase class I/II-fold pyridoxal phosphate-dependent enzyme [Defluviitaleaceae bacterium]
MDYLSEKVRRLTPYVAGIQPREAGWIKLNTNENPYPPSPKVMKALQGMDIARLRLYPDTLGGALRGVIAQSFGIEEENVFCGNGSDEVLALAFQAFFSGKECVLMPDVSYGFYPVWAEMYDVGVKAVPLGNDFTICHGDYKGGSGVVLANPNAPTSLALDLLAIEKILLNNPNGVVLIDEAYSDFANVGSAVPLCAKYSNLLVVRTFSKSHSLAGLRVGYAIGGRELIEGLRRVKDAFNSYPLDLFAQTGAAAAILDKEYWEQTKNRIISTRDKTALALRQMGYRILDSQTNFLFMEVSDANGLYQYLLDSRILARYWDKPRINGFLRVTIGTEAEMEAFIQCVSQL